MAALSLPIGIHTYLMTRALGALSRAPSGLATGVFGTADGSVMMGAVVTHKTLSLTFIGYGHYSIAGSCWHIVHQLLFIFDSLHGTFAHKPFS